MGSARPPSLRQLLLSHELAFLFLVVIAGVLAGFWAYFWQQTSAESIRLNALAHIAQEIRSDLFRQVKEVAVARLRDDPQAEEVYERYTKAIKEGFNALRRKSASRAEDYAVQAMQEAYGRMQVDMNAIFDDPYLLNRIVRSKLLDPSYEQQFTDEFETAFLNFRGLINQALEAQSDMLERWTHLAPLLIPVPIVVAMMLLLFSRASIKRRFRQPVQALVEALRRGDEDELRTLEGRGSVSEIGEIVHALAAMADALARSRDALVDSERQAALGALVPVVAHNIRNPLASIRASAQMLESDSEAGELAENRAAIIETVDRLERWVTALVSYLHPLQPRLRRLPAVDLFEATIRLLKPRLEEKSLTIHRDPWDEDAAVEADPDLMEQALYALLTNAVEASPAEGGITIAVHASERGVVLEIADEGGGIGFVPEPDGLEPGPTTKKRGTGLGIPVAFKVCKAHGWELSFDVTAGTGTRVRLLAPVGA